MWKAAVFTGYVFDELKERDILRFEGPLGNFFIRNDDTQRPMIMMGGRAPDSRR